MNNPNIVSQAEWLEARKALLAKEKELTRFRDQLAAERRALPWVKVEKQYVFDAPQGKVTLADLFDGRSQLFVKHFMMGPGQVSQCVGCSLEVDHIEGALVHLQNHDVSYAVVARAPIAEIEKVRQRMGWRFTWVSSLPLRVQLRLPRLVHPEADRDGPRFLQLRIRESGPRGSIRRQRLHQGRRRPDLPHLFHI